VTASDPSLSNNQLDSLFLPSRVPRATYRVQLNPQFTFQDAKAIVPYLAALGVSHLYASPILQARPDSTHGYDTTDYSRLNEQLGTDDDFDALVTALHDHDMGLIVDMVPNHMGIGTDANKWWMDVLENGPSSVWAPVFDISWQPVKAELANKVLLPVFDEQYGKVLESGKVTLKYRGGAFFIDYNGMIFPITPDSYNMILNTALDHIQDSDAALPELQSIMTALGHLPPYTDQSAGKIAERSREKKIAKRRLAAITNHSKAISAAIDHAVQSFSGQPGQSESFDRLHTLLDAQPYRFAAYQVAGDEINYRRFFNINDMAAIRIETPEVFDAVHQRIVKLIADGHIDGLRIDHPDGLRDPATYFQKLQTLFVETKCATSEESISDDMIGPWLATRQSQAMGGEAFPFYVVVEKILSETEPLPADWMVSGTTGYDFLNLANGIFVDSRHAERMTEIYQRFTQRAATYEDLVYNAKLATMAESLASEINALGHELDQIAERSRAYRDFTLNGLTRALREVIASMSIYRTYLTSPDALADRDRDYILKAVNDARRRNPSTLRSLLTFVRDTLLLRNLGDFKPEDHERVINFVMKFQQMTGPVMAKSVEDTVFYVYNRLISLNEVGGHPDQFGLTVEHFHDQNTQRANEWPHAMLASSTHDTKRSEDVRARINVLSEMPDDWEAAVGRWSEMNRSKKMQVDDMPAPDANDEYLYYQTLLGMWDASDGASPDTQRDRLHAYMRKALNEGKVNTSWVNPNDEYVAAVDAFIDQTLDDQTFLNDFLVVQQHIAFYGKFNSLSQTLLKLTAPGVPDIYQGTELWDLSLVDPDNRRPVDYIERQRVLSALDLTKNRTTDQALPEIDHSMNDGAIKLFLIAKALQARRSEPELFANGSYEPLKAEGSHNDHVCAFLRHRNGRSALIAVPRLIAGLLAGETHIPFGKVVWHDTSLVLPTHLQNTTYQDMFTGLTIRPETGRLQLADIYSRFPAALLISN
jgi:(1->4)-alpha-D-glucan 1-alpha-D-glucosylmutase